MSSRHDEQLTTEKSVVEVITTAPDSRGAKKSRISLGAKIVTVSALSFALGLGILGTRAFTSQQDQGSQSAVVAVPPQQNTQQIAQKSFADRSEEISRNAIRRGLSDEVLAQNERARNRLLDSTLEEARRAESTKADEDRDQLLTEDLKKVEAQTAKIRKEIEEADRRLVAEFRRIQAEVRTSDRSTQEAEFSAESAKITASLSDKTCMPLRSNYRIGAGFGQRGLWARYHTGQDFSAPIGTPIYAVADGIVLSPTPGGWAGNNVIIRHSGGATLYAHMSRRVVSPGEFVKGCQLIGYVGETGRAFGPHLHFEYYAMGATPGSVYEASNPMTFLRRIGAYK